MKKLSIIVTIILTILFIPTFSTALKVSISPAHLYFSGDTDKILCKELTVLSDTKITLTGEDKWSTNKSGGKLSEYALNSEQLKIKTSYSNKIIINTEKTTEICINATNSGNYYGVILYKSPENSVGIGVLIEANISGENNKLQSNPLNSIALTGFVTNENNQSQKSPISILILLLMVVLVILCLMLSRKIRNKREEIC